ncbi:restriction endonuclease subunit S [Vibrio vulnificus]|nr:restriction endonuclease subunit S [Vibrio vulnificus]
MVPNGWEEKSLKDICKKTISYGIVQTGENIENGVPCVRVVDLSKNTLNPVEMIKTSDEIHQSYKKTILCEGELMMALRGEIGLVKKVTPELIGANITRGLARLSPIKSVDSDYLLWTLRSNKIKNELSRKSGGSALQEIALGSLRKVVLPIPPLQEQRKIAQILSTWERGIATTEKLIDASKQQKKALMQQLLTGKQRLIDPETGKAFEGDWEEVKLGELGTVISGGTPSTSSPEYWDGDIHWVTPTDITKLRTQIIQKTSRKITSEGLRNSSAKLVPARSLLICTRATIGELAITATEMCTNQGFKNIIPSACTDVAFLYYLIQSSKHRLVAKASGSTFLELSKKDFENILFHIPSFKEQQKIASVLTAADKEIELLAAKLAHLKQEKKALMQQLLTGKRRVSLSS